MHRGEQHARSAVAVGGGPRPRRAGCRLRLPQCQRLPLLLPWLVGRRHRRQSLLEAQPTLIGSGLFGRYVTCLDTGESVILDDFEMFNSMLGLDCRFDIRVVQAGVDLISLTFSDVTDRFPRVGADRGLRA